MKYDYYYSQEYSNTFKVGQIVESFNNYHPGNVYKLQIPEGCKYKVVETKQGSVGQLIRLKSVDGKHEVAKSAFYKSVYFRLADVENVKNEVFLIMNEMFETLEGPFSTLDEAKTAASDLGINPSELHIFKKILTGKYNIISWG